MKTDYEKAPSLWSAIALSITGMVGSGWLFSAQLNAKLAGNYAFLAWFVAALLALAVGLCLAQVVMAFPVRGVTTRLSALSHNYIFGMPFAFAAWFGLMAMVATEAQATTQYLAAALPQLKFMVDGSLNTHGKFFALGILLLFLLINYFGIIWLSLINNTVTILKIFAPALTIIVFLLAHFDSSNFSLVSNSNYSPSAVITAMVSAGLIYSYNGFQISVAFASELKNPKRNIPLALIISIFAVMLLYMVLQAAFMGAVPHAYAANGWAQLNFHSPLVDLSLLLGLNFLTALLLVDSVFSPSGTGFSYLGSSARMYYAMAAEGQMPRWSIAKLHPKYKLCRRSLLLNWLLTSLVLWNSDSWAGLMVIVTGYNLIGYMAAPIAMGAIKPTTRWWGGAVFILLGIVMSTITANDFLVMNASLMVVMVVFALGQIKPVGRINVINLTVPFLVYLWSLYFWHNVLFIAVVSAVFYWLVTSKNYLEYCRKFRQQAENLV